MENKDILILGAGVSGLGASHSLRQKGYSPIVLEKDSTYGGLCGNFQINGFRFDRFVHFTFSENEVANHIFNSSSPEIIRHIPNAYNLYNSIWIKHPAQNNLYPLGEVEKKIIIEDFKQRPHIIASSSLHNYEEWLRTQYGNYFAEHFPMAYTRKYWMCEARELETKWVGNRLYQPSVEEIIRGSETTDTPVTYYAKEMRYPKKGGFKSFFKVLAEGLNIRYNSEIVEIYPVDKCVKLKSGEIYPFDRLISSLPLPEVLNMLKNVPEEVIRAGQKLKCTCGYQISIGLSTKNIPPYLWWYIYDEDILSARVYSPSLKSPDNAPEGCSSLQLEVYCEKDKYSKAELLKKTVGKFLELNILNEKEILFIDIRFENYANVIFDHNIYEARNTVRDYLLSIGIETIGRFGMWDYLWSDQSLLSGLKIEKSDLL